jgi:acetyl-CoA carboxylase biotin carboxyl carrier protein
VTAPKTGRVADTLTEDEVRQVARLIETLNGSTFDYLQLELGELKLTIAKSGAAVPGASAASPAAPAASVAPAAAAAATAPPAAGAAPAAAAAVDDGTRAITSPMIGRFYSQSEPGAAPYVTVGAKVDETSTVGLVEAMKMFNAVHAGVKGTITQILVQDAALVEYGQVLFRVKPD